RAPIELLHDGAAQRRLTDPGRAGHEHQPLVFANRGQHLLTDGVVRSAVIEEARIRVQRERLLDETVEGLVGRRSDPHELVGWRGYRLGLAPSRCRPRESLA